MLGPRSVEISEAQLQQRIAQRFPIDSRVLRLFDVTLGVPRLTLLPESNRIATELDVRVGSRWLAALYRGTLALSYGLRFEAADYTLRLADVRVERLQIDAAPAELQRELDGIGIVLAERLLDDRVIHALRPQDIEAMRRQRLMPGDIRVTRRGISIALTPIPSR